MLNNTERPGGSWQHRLKTDKPHWVIFTVSGALIAGAAVGTFALGMKHAQKNQQLPDPSPSISSTEGIKDTHEKIPQTRRNLRGVVYQGPR